MEHNRDGRSFAPITTVAASGNSRNSIDYTFLHTQPSAGINYYRLTLVDKDGRKTVFAIRDVTIGTAPVSGSLYPNPATEYIRVSHPNVEKGIITIIDKAGRRLKVVRFIGSAETQVPLNNLTTGIYFLQVLLNDGTIVTTRFVKK